MTADERVVLDAGPGGLAQLDRALVEHALHPARRAAFGPGEFVGQESFVTASQVLRLATRAGVGPGVRVLDLCCGVGGPGALVANRLGCDYLGIDQSPGAVELARARAGSDQRRSCRFTVGHVPPVPATGADVVLLLETLLAFRDKQDLLAGIATALAPGGRLALTAEVGAPLTPRERRLMPADDTVWPVSPAELQGMLGSVGLRVLWWEDWTWSHQATSGHLARAYLRDQGPISAQLGEQVASDLVAAHLLWHTWLRHRRVRKQAVVAVRA